jgi:cytochrome c
MQLKDAAVRLKLLSVFTALMSCMIALPISAGAVDIKNGRAVYKRCSACHSLEPSQNGIGPTLYKLLGRRAGTVPGYLYSSAMKNAGIVWNAATLTQYLRNPNRSIPGSKMEFSGISNARDMEDLLAYLRQAAQ